MTEENRHDGAKRPSGAVLSEFRTALASAREKRAIARHVVKLHDLALAAGRPALGGFVPLLVAARQYAEPKREVILPNEGRSITAARLAAWEAERHTERLPQQAPLYRATLARAKHEAAIARARMRAEREALRLPVHGRRVGEMSFAPRGGEMAVAQEVAHPAKGDNAPVPGLRRGRSVPGVAAMVENTPRDLGVALTSQKLEAQAVAERQGVAPFEIKRALDEYFFRQSRLPPNGGAGFNPLLSPVWAGLKIPG